MRLFFSCAEKKIYNNNNKKSFHGANTQQKADEIFRVLQRRKNTLIRGVTDGKTRKIGRELVVPNVLFYTYENVLDNV